MCKVCGLPLHWCQNCDTYLTGHHGKTPARFCDDCRYEEIMTLGLGEGEVVIALPEPTVH